jgi:predicted lysophospholipase L1 biosynthesis ABC-type transport system permease subunit
VLIDDRLPPPSGHDRPIWEPNWRLWAWVLTALASAVGCFVTGGLLSYVLVCVALACGAHAVTRALPYGDGLREYRQ